MRCWALVLLCGGIVPVTWSARGSAAAEPPAATPGPAVAEDGGDEAETPVEALDPAFQRYIDGDLLWEAIAAGEPGSLTDAALQLHVGERVLFRTHRGVSADAVFRMAIKAAVRDGDAASLDRLATALTAAGKADLSAQVAAAKSLAAGKRSYNPMAAADRAGSPEGRAAVLFYSQQLQALWSRGGRADVDAVAAAIKDDRDLSDESTTALAKAVAETRDATPAQPSADSGLLAALSGPTRGLTGGLGTYSINYTIINAAGTTVSFSLHGSGKTYSLASGKKGSYVATQKWDYKPYIKVFQPVSTYLPPTMPGVVAISLPQEQKTKYYLANGTFYLRRSGAGFTFSK